MMAPLPLADFLPRHAVMMFPIFPLAPFTFTMLTRRAITVTVAIAVVRYGSGIRDEEGESAECGEE